MSEKELENIKNLLYLIPVKQYNTKSGRHYIVDGIDYKFLSVSTILSKTKSESDKEGLLRWRNRVGEEEAEKISKKSLNRGSVMHDCLDYYFEKFQNGISKKEFLIESMEKVKTKYLLQGFDLEYIKNGQRLFIQLYKSGIFNNVKHSIAREVPIYNYWKNLENEIVGYCGTFDHFALIEKNGILKLVLIDYKNSIKTKNANWIKDYFLQVSAYVKAIEKICDVTGLESEIWISCESGEVQKFELSSEEINKNFEIFKSKVEELK